MILDRLFMFGKVKIPTSIIVHPDSGNQLYYRKRKDDFVTKFNDKPLPRSQLYGRRNLDKWLSEFTGGSE